MNDQSGKPPPFDIITMAAQEFGHAAERVLIAACNHSVTPPRCAYAITVGLAVSLKALVHTVALEGSEKDLERRLLDGIKLHLQDKGFNP